MPVYKGFKSEIDKEKIVRLMGYNTIDEVGPQVINIMKNYIKKIYSCQPKVIYKLIDNFRFIKNDKLYFAGNYILKGKELSKFKESEKLLIAVITVGDCIENLINEAQKRDLLTTYVLDIIGSYLLEIMAEEFWLNMKNKFKKKNYKTTSFLAPGNGDFSLSEQRVIFSYLNPEKIGVTLNDSCLMSPVKSLSVLMGIGKNIEQSQDAHNCQDCDKEDCFLRRMIY